MDAAWWTAVHPRAEIAPAPPAFLRELISPGAPTLGIAPDGHATLTTALKARIGAWLEWTWSNTMGETYTVRSPLHPDDLRVAVTAGAAVLTGGRLESAAVWSSTVYVQFTPVGTTLSGPSTTASVTFVAPTTASELVVMTEELADGRYVRETGHFRRAAGSATPTLRKDTASLGPRARVEAPISWLRGRGTRSRDR